MHDRDETVKFARASPGSDIIPDPLPITTRTSFYSSERVIVSSITVVLRDLLEGAQYNSEAGAK